jgi:Ca-activated chloride channel family protein
MNFAAKPILWLLLVVPPALVVFFWWSWRRRQQLLTRFIQARLLPALTVRISPTRQKLRMGCIVLAAACLLAALARPQLGFDWEEVKQRGLDIVLAIDTSRSMLAQDVAPNRLARAKLAALDLMQQAKSDRLGLVAFAGRAFLQCPLTIDDSAFRRNVDDLNTKSIPEGGTAIAEAIQTALGAFKEGENHKVLVLMTDGEDQDSGAVAAAEKAAQQGLRIYTIGIGTPDGQLLSITDDQGHSDYVRDEQGNVVKSHLNEGLLREIASATGGFYLPLRGPKVMDTLFQHEQGLNSLPKSESDEKLVRRYHERYHWPLGIAIGLLLLEMLLPESKHETNKASALQESGAVPQVAAVLMLLLSVPAIANGSPSSALREYRSGQYQRALKDYEAALKKRTGDPRLHFNTGAAAYRSRDFEKAAKEFGEALQAQDLNLQEQAYYNLGNSLFYQGENISELEKRGKTWEESLKNFQMAMSLQAQDGDAKYNYDLVKKKLEELRQQQQQQKQDSKNPEPSEEAKKAKAAADRAVNERNYSRAFDIMNAQLQKDPTTEYYKDFIQRLDLVAHQVLVITNR